MSIAAETLRFITNRDRRRIPTRPPGLIQQRRRRALHGVGIATFERAHEVFDGSAKFDPRRNHWLRMRERDSPRERKTSDDQASDERFLHCECTGGTGSTPIEDANICRSKPSLRIRMS